MPRKSLKILSVALLGLFPAQITSADGLAGAYLAARQASFSSDYSEAAEYYARALAMDPDNPALMENAASAYFGLGEIDKALPIARRMQLGGYESQVAHMVLTLDQLKRGDFAQAVADIEAGRSVGTLVDGLVIAWARLAQGEMSESLAAFGRISQEPGLEVFGYYHKALALAFAGDFEGADYILSGQAFGPFQATRRGVLAQVEILSQLERNGAAIELIDALFGGDLDPGIADMRARLVAGETLPFTVVTSALDGLSEVFFTVAGALNGEASENYTLLYTRAAEYLRPDHVEAILMSAGLLEELGQFELATQAYNRVPPDDASYHIAEIGRASALRNIDKPDAAIEVLTQLVKTHGQLPIVHVTLGDTLRQMERYGEAVKAYDKAIEIYGEPAPGQWFVYYSRGIANEREGNWQQADSDLRMALKLRPDQPQVLNYLGYSLVELQINLDEALGMIERAVAARPDSGYITDSLGWVLYRLGRYDEAVVQMERAVELMPVDPIVTDHLGDVYWAVGRQREAEFQWRRAMSFDPVEPDLSRIRRKLEVGLDVVLEEEGAAPITVANDR